MSDHGGNTRTRITGTAGAGVTGAGAAHADPAADLDVAGENG